MFTCCEFEINGYEVKLALPEVKYADKLYDIIAHDRAELAHFLPWAGKMSRLKMRSILSGLCEMISRNTVSCR